MLRSASLLILLHWAAWGGTGVSIYVDKAWRTPRAGEVVHFPHPVVITGQPSTGSNEEFSRPMDLQEGDRLTIALALRAEAYLVEYEKQRQGPEYQMDKWVVNLRLPADMLLSQGLKLVEPGNPRRLVELEVGTFRLFEYVFEVVPPEKEAAGIEFYTIMTEENKSQWAGSIRTRQLSIASAASVRSVPPAVRGGMRADFAGSGARRVRAHDSRGRLLMDFGVRQYGSGAHFFDLDAPGPAHLSVEPVLR